MSGTKEYQVHIPRLVHNKIMHWVNSTDIEVSGFGKVIYHAETGVFEITDAYLLPQEGGAAHTDIDADGISKLMYTSRAVPGELKWWWHSHVNMAVFWSGTDMDTIKELGSQGWVIASVFNKRYESRSALCTMTESEIFGPQVSVLDEIMTYVDDGVHEHIAKWDEEFKANVRTKPATPMGWGDWQGDRAWDRKPAVLMPGEQGTLVDMTKEFHSQPTLLETELDDYAIKQGLMGYGAAVEAYALGMAPAAYVKKINGNDAKAVSKLENKLERLLDNGKLDEIHTRFHG